MFVKRTPFAKVKLFLYNSSSQNKTDLRAPPRYKTLPLTHTHTDMRMMMRTTYYTYGQTCRQKTGSGQAIKSAQQQQ